MVWRWRLFAGVGLLGGLGLHGWFVASWFGLLVQLVVRRRLCNGLQCWVIFGLSTVSTTFDGSTIFIWVVSHAGEGQGGFVGGVRVGLVARHVKESIYFCWSDCCAVVWCLDSCRCWAGNLIGVG